MYRTYREKNSLSKRYISAPHEPADIPVTVMGNTVSFSVFPLAYVKLSYVNKGIGFWCFIVRTDHLPTKKGKLTLFTADRVKMPGDASFFSIPQKLFLCVS